MSATERLPHPLQSEGPPGGMPPARPKKPVWPYAVIGLLVLALVAVGVVAFQQHQQVQDRQQALTLAANQRNQARAAAATLTKRVGQLKTEIAHADTTTKGEAGKVAALQTELQTMVGPALADGKYFGRLYAVGATQDPPKLVIDLEQFFTGAAADQAAKQDGNLPPGETHVPNDVYVRNDSPQWRVLKVDPSTKVSLTTSPFGSVDKPLVVPLGRFGKIWSKDAGNVTGFPYWITVKNHTVVAIAEQYMP